MGLVENLILFLIVSAKLWTLAHRW